MDFLSFFFFLLISWHVRRKGELYYGLIRHSLCMRGEKLTFCGSNVSRSTDSDDPEWVARSGEGGAVCLPTKSPGVVACGPLLEGGSSLVPPSFCVSAKCAVEARENPLVKACQSFQGDLPGADEDRGRYGSTKQGLEHHPEPRPSRNPVTGGHRSQD